MNHSLESLGWTLVHFCWQAGAVAAIYGILDRALSKRSSYLRYSLALAALLSMPLAAGGTFLYEQRQIPAVNASVDGSAPNASTPSLSATVGNATQQFVASAATVADRQSGGSLELSVILLWLDAIWLAGVMLLSMRSIGGWLFLERMRKRTRMEAPAVVQQLFEEVRRRLSIVRPVVLRVSDEIISPMAMGAFRSVVILPLAAISSLTPEELEVVLAHELAHIRRADYVWNMVQTLLETVFFFHPAVWWVSRCVREQRELCCDDVALTACSDPVIYASALLRLEEQRRKGIQFAMALDGSGSRFSLLTRVRRILGEPPLKKSRSFAAHSAVVFGLTVGACLFPASQLSARLLPPLKMQIEAATSHLPVPTLAHNQNSSQSSTASTSSSASTLTAEAKPSANPKPSAAVAAAEPNPDPDSDSDTEADVQDEPAPAKSVSRNPLAPKSDYIDQMKAAGYDVDLDKLIAFKIHGVTPEYAREMAKTGYPKPSADDLIAMKIQGISPEYVDGLRKSGLAPDNLHDLFSYKIFSITPEYAAGMKAAGFGALPAKKLIELKVQGVTPEYAKSIRTQFPDASVEDLVQMKIFHIDSDFIAAAKRHGFDHLPIKKLVQLRITGLLDDTQ